MNKKTESQGAGAAETRTEGVEGQALLEKILDQGRWKDPAGRAVARDIIGELAKQVLEGEITISKDTEAMINARIAAIDA